VHCRHLAARIAQEQNPITEASGSPFAVTRILSVDDFEPYRLFVVSLLHERSDLKVICGVSNGLEAVQKAQELKPDLILMDISLPLMNGWEVTRLLKNNESTRHIPIIVLTAHALVTDRERAFEAGCDDYDTKPVEFGRLSEKIDNLLTVRKS